MRTSGTSAVEARVVRHEGEGYGSTHLEKGRGVMHGCGLPGANPFNKPSRGVPETECCFLEVVGMESSSMRMFVACLSGGFLRAGTKLLCATYCFVVLYVSREAVREGATQIVAYRNRACKTPGSQRVHAGM